MPRPRAALRPDGARAGRRGRTEEGRPARRNGGAVFHRRPPSAASAHRRRRRDPDAASRAAAARRTRSSRTGCSRCRRRSSKTCSARCAARSVDIVSLDEMHRRLIERDFRRRFVCLTFDDGYRDNLRYALPILQKYDAPFALYIPTSFPDGFGELWWLTLEAAIARSHRISLVMDGADRRYDCDSTEAKYELLRAHLLVAAQPRQRGRSAPRGARPRRALRRRPCGAARRAVHDLGRDRRDRRRSARDHRRAHGQSRDAAQGERRGGAPRDARERRRDRGRARQAAGAFQLSGRRPHLGGPARVRHRRASSASGPRSRRGRACCFPSMSRT